MNTFFKTFSFLLFTVCVSVSGRAVAQIAGPANPSVPPNDLFYNSVRLDYPAHNSIAFR